MEISFIARLLGMAFALKTIRVCLILIILINCMAKAEENNSEIKSNALRLWGRGLTAQSIMTPNPITISPKDVVEEAIDLLEAHNIRHLPVVDNGKLIGIVSDRDLRKFAKSVSEMIDYPEAARTRLQTPIQTVYRSDFITLGPEAELDEIIEIFAEEKIGAIPIVRQRDFFLIGIVSYIDVLKQIQNIAELSTLEERVL